MPLGYRAPPFLGGLGGQQWLMYDILAAKVITGVYDGCLFSLRPPQAEFPDQNERRGVRSRMVRPSALRRSGSGGRGGQAAHGTEGGKHGTRHLPVARHQVHAKVYGLPFDHFNNNTDGPLSWITSGSTDVDMYIELPHEPAPQVGHEVRHPAQYAGGVGRPWWWASPRCCAPYDSPCEEMVGGPRSRCPTGLEVL